MRVFPYREMISDMIRFSRLPFCGLRPFMRIIAAVASSALAAGCPTGRGRLEAPPGSGDPCSLSLVEGGPHLGDCSLWTATVLRAAGVQLRALAFEPLPDASALFRQAVLENGFAGSVAVHTAALGRASDKRVELVYYRGHNGQATVRKDDIEAGRPGEMDIIRNVPQATMDEEVPASWPVVDFLKLSVNGAEKDTLVGARRLLAQRRLCSVLMHAQKAARGRPAVAPNATKFSAELLRLLEKGDMEVFTHRDAGAEGGPVQRATSPADLDRVFDDPELSQQDYILARSRGPQCALARRHFQAAVGSAGLAALER